MTPDLTPTITGSNRLVAKSQAIQPAAEVFERPSLAAPIPATPWAHAEMEAIRAAARVLGTRDLSGCTLYGTSPACQMCETAAHWANIEAMVHSPALTEAGRPRYRRC